MAIAAKVITPSTDYNQFCNCILPYPYSSCVYVHSRYYDNCCSSPSTSSHLRATCYKIQL